MIASTITATISVMIKLVSNCVVRKKVRKKTSDNKAVRSIRVGSRAYRYTSCSVTG
jgi:hypothetical protein